MRISFHVLKQQEDKTPQIQGAVKKSVLVCSYNAENTIRSNYFTSKSEATQIMLISEKFAGN